MKNESDLTLPAIKALESIADEKSIKIVEELAHGKHCAKKNPAIQQAALEALPRVREAAERSRSNSGTGPWRIPDRSTRSGASPRRKRGSGSYAF